MSEFQRLKEAYLMIAKEANYRPYAPGDGHGHVQLTEEELQDNKRLNKEAERYACCFSEEADEGKFHIGCPNYETNIALVLAVEIARNCCASWSPLPLVLAKLLVRELERAELGAAA